MTLCWEAKNRQTF